MQIKKDTKVKVQYRPELGTGTVLQVAEAPGSYTQIDHMPRRPDCELAE
jgi:hypothetical protein